MLLLELYPVVQVAVVVLVVELGDQVILLVKALLKVRMVDLHNLT